MIKNANTVRDFLDEFIHVHNLLTINKKDGAGYKATCRASASDFLILFICHSASVGNLIS